MIRKLVYLCSFGVIAAVLAPPEARALPKAQQSCVETVAKESGKYVKARLKAINKCRDANLKVPDSCADLTATFDALESKLRAGIQKKCAPPALNSLTNIGFPGTCSDTNGGDFTATDLQDCMLATHASAVDALIAATYGGTVGPLGKEALKCQKDAAANAAKFASVLQKTVQQCRNGLLKGKLSGFAAADCATAEPKSQAKIEKARTSAETKIEGSCPDDVVGTLDICSPAATTGPGAAECLLDLYGATIDNPTVGSLPDLIDLEYAAPPSCGDGILNQLNEECDGNDAAACPNQCGAPGGNFECLCLTIPRIRVLEHNTADLDNGWNGNSHDSSIVEGRGYVADLYDCDGPAGPDVECVIGPSCTGNGAPCSSDGDCGFDGPCRKRRTATGLHCNLNIQQACTTNGDCAPGDFCVKTPYGPPLPLSQGLSVCSETVFVEDVTGTINLATGAGHARIIQKTRTITGADVAEPCPLCGGFCNAPSGVGGASAGARTPCDDDDDCPVGVGCVTANICSFGPRKDQACRPSPPFGGISPSFGTTSLDCPMPLGSLGDIVTRFEPASTGAQTLLPGHPCNLLGFEGNACVGGTNEGRPCSGGGDCPSGTCLPQCFCPSQSLPGAPQAPNFCNPACVGGGNDGNLCEVGTCADGASCVLVGMEYQCASGADAGKLCCDGGFCHAADCRENMSDDDSAQEGSCTAGPFVQKCSVTTIKSCDSNADCAPPECTFCQVGETCDVAPRQCFVNSGIFRTGMLGSVTPTQLERTMAAIFCIAPTSNASVNLAAGTPGPGTLTGPQTVVITGF